MNYSLWHPKHATIAGRSYFGNISTTYFKHNDVCKVIWTNYGNVTAAKPKHLVHVPQPNYKGDEDKQEYADIPHQSEPFCHYSGSEFDSQKEWCLQFREFVPDDFRPCLFLKNVSKSDYGSYYVMIKNVGSDIFYPHDVKSAGTIFLQDKYMKYYDYGPIEIEFKVCRLKDEKFNLSDLSLLQKLQNQELMDMSFKTEDGIDFKAHKLIMSHVSQVIKARLQTQVGDKDDPILVPYHSDIFKTFLEFVNGKIINTCDISKYMDLFMVCNFYDCKRFSGHCQEMIILYLTTQNLMQVLCHDIVALVEAKDVVQACVTLLEESKLKDIKDWDPKEPRVADFLAKHPELEFMVLSVINE